MTLRTVPSTMPALRSGDYNAFKVVRASKIRDIVAAQNWLWANMVRLYSFCAYEGNGNYMNPSYTDPSDNTLDEVNPLGGGGKLLLAFMVPKNWGPSTKLTVYGASTLAKLSTSGYGKIVVGVYDMEGNYLGVSGSDTYSTTGAHDWTIDLNIPRANGPVQVKVWAAPSLGFSAIGHNPDQYTVHYVCARYNAGVAADIITGDVPAATWQPMAHDYIVAGQNQFLSSALMKTILRNVLHLYSQRPPMVLASYLGTPYCNTNTWTEVAKYKVHLAPHVTSIKGKLLLNCTAGGAGNEVRFLVDTTVKETFTALAAGQSEKTLAVITGLTGDTDITITVEAKSSTASTDWGTEVLGVHVWEEDVTLSLPAGSTIPASYAPVDESNLIGDELVLESDLIAIIKNNTWLMANRLKNLIHDWRHRAYKNQGATVAAPGSTHEGGNWTRGYNDNASPTGFPGHPKNLTVFGQSTVADSLGSTTPDDVDGQGKYSATLPGRPTAGGFVSDSSWPSGGSQQWTRHGRRIGRFMTTTPVAYSAISADTYAQLLGWVRANRAQPYIPMAFDLGQDGPLPEDAVFVNQAHVSLHAETQSTVLDNATIIGGYQGDKRPRWYGPLTAKHADVGTASLRGRLSSKAVTTNSLEGALFEVEVRATLFMDAPLTNATLALL